LHIKRAKTDAASCNAQQLVLSVIASLGTKKTIQYKSEEKCTKNCLAGPLGEPQRSHPGSYPLTGFKGGPQGRKREWEGRETREKMKGGGSEENRRKGKRRGVVPHPKQKSGYTTVTRASQFGAS